MNLVIKVLAIKVCRYTPRQLAHYYTCMVLTKIMITKFRASQFLLKRVVEWLTLMLSLID